MDKTTKLHGKMCSESSWSSFEVVKRSVRKDRIGQIGEFKGRGMCLRL